MPSPAPYADAAKPDTRSDAPRNEGPADYPVRDYIGAMSAELARMARWDEDEALARVLEAAARMCEQPAPRAGAVVLEESKQTGRS